MKIQIQSPDKRILGQEMMNGLNWPVGDGRVRAGGAAGPSSRQ